MNFLKSSEGQSFANEQPASISGSKTVLLGHKIFAVSAIKCTPQKMIISASVFAAFLESSKLSPIKSAMSCISGV